MSKHVKSDNKWVKPGQLQYKVLVAKYAHCPGNISTLRWVKGGISSQHSVQVSSQNNTLSRIEYFSLLPSHHLSPQNELS